MGGPVVAVVPSRFASTRFPGKPLALIDGIPMIVRVLQQAAKAQYVDEVYVATDHEPIAKLAEKAGFAALMTPPECASGTDRIAAGLEQIRGGEPSLIVNIQGDEPIIEPDDIDALIRESINSQCPMGTLARPFPSLERFHDPNVVKVVRAQNGRALYFSRAPIPHNGAQPLMHVGLYAYVPPALRKLSAAAPTELELCERLEQLRALELGIDIHVALATSTRPSIAVDIPDDIERVEAALRNINLEEVSSAQT